MRISPVDVVLYLAVVLPADPIDQHHFLVSVRIQVGDVHTGRIKALEIGAEVGGKSGRAAPVDVGRHVIDRAIVRVGKDQILVTVPVQVSHSDARGCERGKLGPTLGRESPVSAPVQIRSRKRREFRHRSVRDGQIQMSVSVQVGNGNIGRAEDLKSEVAVLGQPLFPSEEDVNAFACRFVLSLGGGGHDVGVAVLVQVTRRDTAGSRHW